MIEEISGDTGTYLITHFEDYYEIKEGYYLLKSYFYRESISQSLCQWHIGKMNEEGTHFEIKQRLGSTHIEDEDAVIDTNMDKASDAVDKIILAG